jgi:phosphoribosylamine--glycine ligase
MRVLVVGSGGREHALAWRLAQEGTSVCVAPGNGGTPDARPLDALDVGGLANVAEREQFDLTIVGPEAPLAAGIVDTFRQRGLKVFGPTRAAAQLEWSKAFAKDVLRQNGIPTARAESVTSRREALDVVARTGVPIVLKADGLASGKGVFVVHTPEELDAALHALFEQRALGAAADNVLVEELLEGPELSVMAFSDGERIEVMAPARDYKRLLDDDRGPNTGGMGGMAWPSYATPALLDEVERTVLRPTIDAMRANGTPYNGVLYAGLMLTRDGPRVLEFNCRFGDPETQLVLPLLEGSLTELCAAMAEGELPAHTLTWRQVQTYGVVLAAPGYPEGPHLGDPISGLTEVPSDVQVFHAGTRHSADGVVTSSGRVLSVVGEDRTSVYTAARTIDFPGKHYRRDIGAMAMPVGAAR